MSISIQAAIAQQHLEYARKHIGDAAIQMLGDREFYKQTGDLLEAIRHLENKIAVTSPQGKNDD